MTKLRNEDPFVTISVEDLERVIGGASNYADQWKGALRSVELASRTRTTERPNAGALDTGWVGRGRGVQPWVQDSEPSIHQWTTYHQLPAPPKSGKV
jgi:hypothetical protein